MIVDSTRPKRRRRWLRFSLRSMLLVVLAFSIWLGYRANKAANQRRAVLLVKELGGSVLYDFEVANASTATPPPLRANYPPGVPWRTFLGWDANNDANAVPLDDSETDTTGLKFESAIEPAEIKSFRKFELVRSTFTRTTAEPPDGPLYDLLGIDWFHAVERVFVGGTRLTDEQLGDLVDALPALKQLDLRGTQVTDAGLAHLSGLKYLEQLWLSGTSVTDAGLLHLSGLKKLKYVAVQPTGATKEGVKRLKNDLPNPTDVIVY